MKILTANVHFSPVSFGGATVVTENLARLLSEKAHVAVFTTWSDPAANAYELVRYEAHGVPVFGVKIPKSGPRSHEYRNYHVAEVFLEVVKVFSPDIVHLHSIQGLGATIGVACQLSGIPYVVTIHDCWWICERQFMINIEEKHCLQHKIDLSVCARCVKDFEYTLARSRYLRSVLEGAALILTPSQFHRELHVANGFPAERLKVNRNGVAAPRKFSSPGPEGIVRFGYLGGADPTKGFNLIQKVFSSLLYSNYQLMLVDNTLNRGVSSMRWDGPTPRGRLEIVPSYRQDDMDRIFANFDVLLYPTQLRESFGLGVREALIRDKWVIATDAGATAEEIVDGVNGTVIPMGDNPGPLAKAVADLLTNPAKLKAYQNPLKQLIRTNEEQAEELYRELLAIAVS